MMRKKTIVSCLPRNGLLVQNEMPLKSVNRKYYINQPKLVRNKNFEVCKSKTNLSSNDTIQIIINFHLNPSTNYYHKTRTTAISKLTAGKRTVNEIARSLIFKELII